MARQTYDWDTIRTEYIVGYPKIDPDSGTRSISYPTLKQLAKKYGCAEHTIKVRCSEESWVLRKKAAAKDIQEKINRHRVESFLDEEAYFDGVTIRKLQKIHRIIDVYLAQYLVLLDDEDATLPTTLVIRENSEGEEKLPIIKPADLKSLVETLDKGHSLAQRCMKKGERQNPDYEVIEGAVADAIRIAEGAEVKSILGTLEAKKANVQADISLVDREILTLEAELQEIQEPSSPEEPHLVPDDSF